VTAVLGRPASVNRVVNGELLVAFAIGTGEQGCDHWAIAGRGLPDDEVIRVAEALAGV
jgi:hypothetical protein